MFCFFASVWVVITKEQCSKDVRTFKHEDRMDSYFLAEMFKYLFLLFSTPSEPAGIDIENYVLTTEAHILPLKLSLKSAFNGNFTFDQVRLLLGLDWPALLLDRRRHVMSRDPCVFMLLFVVACRQSLVAHFHFLLRSRIRRSMSRTISSARVRTLRTFASET